MSKDKETFTDVSKLLKSSLDDIKADIETEFDEFELRKNIFLEEYNRFFPIEKSKERGTADALIWALMSKEILSLYFLGLNGYVIVDLYSILEGLSKREVVGLISKPKFQETTSKILQRMNLINFITILSELKILNKEDIKFAEKITKLRNGIAHRNEKTIANLLNSGRKLHWLDIDSKLSKLDSIPFILNTIKIIAKLASQ